MKDEPKGFQLSTVFDNPAGAKWFPIVSALLPAFLFALVAIFNSTYISNFFSIEHSLWGYFMLGLVVFLSVLSYLLLRRCSAMIVSGQRVKGLVLASLVMVLVVFPAALLIVLGPAALILLGSDLWPLG